MKKNDYINKITEIESNIHTLTNEIGAEEFAPWSIVAKNELGSLLIEMCNILDYSKELLIHHCDLLIDIENVGDKVVEIED
jgi:hypothetical protein